MKTILPKRIWTLIILVCLGSVSNISAQELREFTNRYTNNNVRGNLTITANDIVGVIDRRDDNNTYNANGDYNTKGTQNGRYTTAFIDIDGDPTTFSSSSADIAVPEPDCSTIVYAGLYWSANYYMARSRDPDNDDDDDITPDASEGGDQTNTDVVMIVNNGPFAHSYTARYSQFDSDNSDIQFSPVTSYLVVAQPVNGCGITNGAALAGNIAVIRKGGSCTLRQKVVNAQQAGAVGVVIVNDVDQDLPKLEGDGPAINIPSVSVGNDIRDGLDNYRGDLITLLNNYNGVVLATLSTTGGDQETGLPANDPRKQGPADFRDIKFKVPGGAYVDLTDQNGRTQTIWDGYANTLTNDQTDSNGNPKANDEVQYVCYADVTDLIDPDNQFGTYTVANMNATQGYTSTGDGACGGWMLVVVYEDPLQTSKYIDTREGYVQIFNGGSPEVFDYTGFNTLPGSQPVEVSFGVSSLEGDNGLTGDRLQILNTANNWVSLGTGNDVNGLNPTNNFYNSSITRPNLITGAPEYIFPRDPASENTMGFDADLFNLENSGNTLIGNDQTEATFRLFTNTDRYSVFFGAFAVTVIEPELLIIKRVYDTDGTTDITGGNVELGDEVFYDLEIENIGNEDFQDNTVVITDILPANTNLLAVTQVPPGVTFTEVTPGVLEFDIPSDLVETDLDGEGTKDAPIFIRFRAQLVASCEELRDACSDIISNSATADYIGELSGQPGFASSVIDIGPCRINQGEASNILVNVPPCSQDVTFCNDNLTLVAGTGYDQYTWTGPGIATPVVQLTATNPNANVFVVPNPQTGVYQVVKEDLDPNDGDDCMTLVELFDVEDFRDIQNPILSYVNGTTVVTESCSGLEIPQILLCGDQTLDLMTNFSSTNLDSISWQRLTPSGSCVLDPNDPCSLLSGDCTDANWVEEPGGNTANFTVSLAGDYRILAEFDGGCLIPFYFSVYKNDYQPELDMNPIECGNDGSVTVTNVPNNFAFSLTSGGPYTNTTGIFPISTPGDVTVYAIDTTFPGCEYTATINVPSFDPVFVVTATSPSCVNDDNGTGTGSIQINITGGTPEYQYTINSPVLTNPIIVPNSSANNGNYLQDNLLPGTYTVEMISNRPAPECIDSQTVTINAAPDFDAFARLLAPPTCESGALIEIVVTSGSGNYLYDDGSGNFVTSNIFEVPTPSNPGPNFLFYVSDNSVPAGSPACIIEVPFNDPIPPYQPIVVDNLNVIDPPCPGDGAQVQVDVSPSVAGRTYLYELITVTDPTQDTIFNVVSTIGLTPLQTATFPNVGNSNPGEFYRVRITHNNTTPPNAGTICPVSTVPFQVDDPDAITADVTLQRPLSCITGNEDAIIRIANLAGGNGTYEWSFDNVNFTPVTLPFTDIPIATAGSYIIYIRDASVGDCAVSYPIDVPDRLELDDIVFTPGDDDCPNQTSVVTFDAQPALTAAEIAAGVTITYDVSPDPASGVAATGNTGFVATNTYTITQGVTYTVTARRSDSQCTVARDYRVEPIDQIQITSATQTNPVTCRGGNDGALSFTVDATLFPTFDYTVTGPAPATTVVASGTGVTSPVTIASPGTPLVAGTYTITVNDPSTSGADCSDTATVVITEPANDITFDVDVEQRCSPTNGADNTVTISNTIGGNGDPYTATLTGNGLNVTQSVNVPFTGVPNGNGYQIIVTDVNGCTSAPVIFDISPLPGVTANITTSDLCLDDNIATLTIDILSGTPDYSYTISRNGTQIIGTTALGAGVTTFTTPNLTQDGTYVVTITDSNGCFVEITQPIEPAVNIVAVRTKDITCSTPPNPAADNAQVDFTITGGYTDYDISVSFNGGAFTNHVTNQTAPFTTYTTAVAGTYVFRVTDSEGCTHDSLPIEITDPTPPTITAPDVNLLCFGDQGTAVITIDGPELPYQINFNGAGFVTLTSNQIQFPNLTAGNYTFDILDGRGCPYSSSVDVLQPDEITAVVVDTDITCDPSMGGNVLGNIVLTLSGGTPAGDAAAYTYSVTRDGAPFAIAPTFPAVNQAFFGPLDFGFYEITVTDANNCSRTFSERINNVIDGLGITETASGTCPGGFDLNITITGGSGVNAGPPRTVPGFRIELIGVTGQTDLGDDGTLPPGGPNPVRTITYNGLAYGRSYTIFVRDLATNCTYQEEYIPTPPSAPVVTVTPSPVSCDGFTDGSISFSVAGYDNVPGQSFLWEIVDQFDLTNVIDSGVEVSTGTDPDVFGPVGAVGAGRYILRVTEQAGTMCPGLSAPFEITSPDPLMATAGPVTPANCNTVAPMGGGAQVTITTNGGTPPYSYALVPDGAGAPLPNVLANYPLTATIDLGEIDGELQDIWVRDANGCLFQIDVTTIVTPDPQFTNPPYIVDNPCDANNYTVTTTAIGGQLNAAGNLFYGIDDGTNPIVYVEDGLTHTFTIPTFGTYDLVVRDVNGCLDREPITIFPPLDLTAAFTTIPTCTDPNGVITITSVIGGSDYSTNPGNFTFTLLDSAGTVVITGPQPSNVFPGVPPGSYIVRVTDANGGAEDCTADTPVSIGTPVEPVLLPISVTPITCFGANDGIINAELDPATFDPLATYTYEITAGPAPSAPRPAQASPVFTGLQPGVYTVQVNATTNSVLCTDTQDYEIIEPVLPLATAVIQDQFSCAADGSINVATIAIDIDATTGTGPNYFVTVTRPDGVVISRIPVADINLNPDLVIDAPIAGIYTIVAIDNNNCQQSPPVTVDVPAINPMNNPAVNITQDITCTLDEIVEVSVQGGSGDFIFERIDNMGNVIGAPIDTPPGVFVAQFFTLPRDLGIYTFRITDQGDALGLGAGCTITVSHEIDEYDFIEVIAAQQTPETCFGAADGTVNITISGYIGNYTYQIYEQDGTTPVPGGTGTGTTTTDPDTIVLTNLLAQGAYIIEITETDAPNCVELSNVVTIVGPDRPLQLQILPINNLESCIPGSDGAVQATTFGEQGTVTYTIVPAPTVGPATNTTGLFENLTATAGTYTITATDANGCTDDDTFTIIAPTPIFVDPIPDDTVTCFGDMDVSVTVNANGGQGPGTYIYTLTYPDGSTSTPGSNNVFTQLGPGAYTVTVSDNLNCETSTTFNVDEPNEVTITIDDITDVECGLDFVNVTVSGTSDVAIARYYVVDQNDVETPGGSGASHTFTGLGAGEYRFFAEDVNGCRSDLSSPVPVLPITPIAIILDERFANVNCFNEATGIIDATVSGGIGAYQFRLENTTTGQFWPGPTANDTQAIPQFTDLPPGLYTYYVTSERNCAEQANFEIVNPAEFVPVPPEVTNVLCFGEDNGVIVVFAQGGTPPYSFAISTDPGVFFNDASDSVTGQHTFTNLAPNPPGVPYEVLAQDANGCDQVYIVDITEPEELMIDIVGEVTPETCLGDSDGAVTVEIIGGTPPYEYNITNNDGDFVEVLDPTALLITDLPGGTTTVFIRDANNCRIELPVDIPPGVDINGTLEPALDCPIVDPITGAILQPLAYYVDFDAFGADVFDNNIDIQYILETVNAGDPAPIQSTEDPRRYIVQPNILYTGRMLHANGCERLLGEITVDEYIPLTNLRAEMTGNPEDPNEYEILVEGGADGNPDNYTYYVARLENVIPPLDPNDPPPAGIQNAFDLLTLDDYEELEENIFVIRRTGYYALRVVDNAGCELITVVPLIYINIRVPNYFTPGVDKPETPDDESYWYPRQITPDQDPNNPTTFFFENMEVRVFDRYGRLLAEFKGDQKGWDGVYKGKELPSGDYWYTVILNDAENKEFTGHFTLYR